MLVDIKGYLWNLALELCPLEATLVPGQAHLLKKGGGEIKCSLPKRSNPVSWWSFCET